MLRGERRGQGALVAGSIGPPPFLFCVIPRPCKRVRCRQQSPNCIANVAPPHNLFLLLNNRVPKKGSDSSCRRRPRKPEEGARVLRRHPCHVFYALPPRRRHPLQHKGQQRRLVAVRAGLGRPAL